MNRPARLSRVPSSRLAVVILLTLIGGLLAGCGNKGDLVRPSAAPPATQQQG